MKKKFFKPSKRKIVMFLVIFLVLFFYFPVVKCINGHKVKSSFCKKFDICTIDFYVPIPGALSDHGDSCPANRISNSGLILITAIFLIMSYLVSCLFDHYLKKADR